MNLIERISFWKKINTSKGLIQVCKTGMGNISKLSNTKYTQRVNEIINVDDSSKFHLKEKNERFIVKVINESDAIKLIDLTKNNDLHLILEINPDLPNDVILSLCNLEKASKGNIVLNFKFDLLIKEVYPSSKIPNSFRAKIQYIIDNISSNGFVWLSYEVTTLNSFWVDDVFDKIPDSLIPFIYFYPSEILQNQLKSELFNRNSCELYSAFLVFDNLKVNKRLSVLQRSYYSKIVKSIESGDSSNIKGNFEGSANSHKSINQFTLEKYINTVIPDKSELFKIAANLVKVKVSGKKALDSNVTPQTIKASPKPSFSTWKKVLITGWYGTETNGDKAIIGEVIHVIKTINPDCEIILTTIYHSVSMQTAVEMEGFSQIPVISIYQDNFDQWVKNADAVIMGGGPMMETQEMINVLKIFESAAKYGKERIIFGCGIGPFHTREIEEVTARVVKLATAGFLRDKESWEFAVKMHPGTTMKYACDPAVGYVYRWKKAYTKSNVANKCSGLMVTMLRANTSEFSTTSDSKGLVQTNIKSAMRMASWLDKYLLTKGRSVKLLHMNAPWVGGDDRLFNRHVENAISNINLVENERMYLSLEKHLEAMMQADIALAMRYHGHVFCMALGLPFISVDYTGTKGKVFSLVNRIDYGKWSIKWENLEGDSANNLIEELCSSRQQISEHLNQEAENLIRLLNKTYKDVFEIDLDYIQL